MITGRRIQRVDQPHPLFLCLELSKQGPKDREYLLLAASESGVRCALARERVRGETAAPFTTKLRHHLRNRRLTQLSMSRNAIWIQTEGAGLSVESRPPGFVLFGADERVLASTSGRFRPGAAFTTQPDSVEPDMTQLRELGIEFFSSHLADIEGQDRKAIRQQLGRRRKQLRRRAAAIQGDLDRQKIAQQLRHDAQLLVAHLSRIEPGARSGIVSDWATDPPVNRTLTFEPGKSAAAQADAWFHEAGRFERGATMAKQRLISTQADLSEIERLSLLEESCREEALAPELVQLGSAGQGQRQARKKGAPETRLPYKTFASADGGILLLGRGARDNDTLTFKVARPGDLWLHARGTRGAHVIVRLKKGEECPAERLLDAAALAAHFSEARGESPAEVQYTPRRNVKKPKGLPPGAVLVSQEKVILYRDDPARLTRLLAATS